MPKISAHVVQYEVGEIGLSFERVTQTSKGRFPLVIELSSPWVSFNG